MIIFLKKIKLKRRKLLIFLAVFFFVFGSFLLWKSLVEVDENYPIFDIHEHLGEGNLEKLLSAMKENGIDYSILLGSPRYTLTLQNPGFEDFKKNNNYLLEVAKNNPIKVFCTIDPRNENNLETLKNCLDEGGAGLKLYSGHKASFYRFLGPLDRKEMEETYNYCENNNIPIIFHVNPYDPQIKREFENVLTNYPDAKINCPHWCLSSINEERFEGLYDKYPNLYTDISFGSRFAEDGMRRISNNPKRFKKLVEKYQDRIMFGADMVITDVKDENFVSEMLGCYKKMLEEKEYECQVGEKGSEFSVYGKFKGLNLSKKILKKIYYENPKKFLNIE